MGCGGSKPSYDDATAPTNAEQITLAPAPTQAVLKETIKAAGADELRAVLESRSRAVSAYETTAPPVAPPAPPAVASPAVKVPRISSAISSRKSAFESVAAQVDGAPEMSVDASAAAAAWSAFVEAAEVEDTTRSYAELRGLYQLPASVRGLAAFDMIHERADESMPPRVREMMRVLNRQRERRTPAAPREATAAGSARTSASATAPLSVLISGAGPVGLRCAVESALGGLSVTVIEKRQVRDLP